MKNQCFRRHKHHMRRWQSVLLTVLLPVMLLVHPVWALAGMIPPSITIAQEMVDKHVPAGSTVTIRFTLTHGTYSKEGCELYIFSGDINPLKGDRVDDEAEYAKGFYSGAAEPLVDQRNISLNFDTSKLETGVYTILIYPTFNGDRNELQRADSEVKKTRLYIDEASSETDDSSDPQGSGSGSGGSGSSPGGSGSSPGGSGGSSGGSGSSSGGSGGSSGGTDGGIAPVEGAQAMYRLYYPGTHEHLYTADARERDVLVEQRHWQYEGIAWYAPTSGDPVYRLYNPFTTEHHYTMDRVEYDTLGTVGWNQEGIGWYSDPAQGVPLYRLYCPALGAGGHHFTSSQHERDTLIAGGSWHQEGIGWYGAK